MIGHRDIVDRRAIRSARELANDDDRVNAIALALVAPNLSGFAGARPFRASCVLGLPAVSMAVPCPRSASWLTLHVVAAPWADMGLVRAVSGTRPDDHAAVMCVAARSEPPTDLVAEALHRYGVRVVRLS